MPKKSRWSWRQERLGLAAAGAAVVATALVLVLLVQHLLQQERQQVREQGLSLIRTLSAMPADKLIPESARWGVLTAIHHSLKNSHFAYISLNAADGQVLAEEAAPGVAPERVKVSSEPASWHGRRDVTLVDDSRPMTEFYAPVLAQGEFKALIRIAFFTPQISTLFPRLPFFAALAALILLPAGILLMLIRRQLAPLSQLNCQMELLLNRETVDSQPLAMEASGELLVFAQNFNRYVGQMQQQLDEQEKAQQQLVLGSQMSNFRHARVQSILHSIPEALLVLDQAGRISFSNDKVQGCFELDAPVMEGQTLREWCPYQEVITFLSPAHARYASGIPPSSLVFKVSDSATRTMELSRFPLVSPCDKETIFGTLVVGRDVSELWMAKHDRSEFIAQVAHELKAPLNALSLYSEAMLGEEGQSADFRIEACNVINDEVLRLSQLINNLLNLSKLEGGGLKAERQRVRLHDLLEDTFQQVASASPGQSQLQFELDIPQELSALSADKELLRIAISNLLSNAVKYNRPGGRVKLSAEETETAISISVEDTGLGISEADQARIFDKFFRSSSSAVQQRSGHGLGLSVVKEIVALHHGVLEQQSQLGQGTRFTLLFLKSTGVVKEMVS
ncbi:PAS domain-containing sensor histidine kinase [Pseudomonas benzenivorans]|uniref:histidine kinase n=1 Tax=Pseudomonas benzenivorans TaxID=556533 RepID=A0ABY5H534_9PSED|nr:ATP-binding protein [Pseudomonas benzenivorans]UTW07124.1 hypothetical protein KDW96_18445 [Pseudomonas benzenivorans]